VRQSLPSCRLALTVGVALVLGVGLAGPASAATRPTAHPGTSTSPGAAHAADRAWARRSTSLAQAPASLLDATRHGTRVRVVSMRLRAGRPAISVSSATGRPAALAEIARLQTAPDTLSVAVDVPVHADAAPSNDPGRSGQWALDRFAAEDVWTTNTGVGVTVAVVDSGIDASHPDLTGRVLPGTDLVTGTGDGSADGYGHGTHVAGIIAATAGNGIGVAGLAPGVALLPVRVLDDSGTGWSSTTAAGIIWAVDHGAQVVNLSLGSTVPSAVSQQAVDYASAHGVLVVAAVGNGRDTGNLANYPAAYDGVLGVGATDQADASASFSTTGASVDVAAPGVSIESTYKGAAYATMSGTSMATPYVSASAALLKAANPALAPADLTRLLEQSATDLGAAGRDDQTGFGLVSPGAAVCLVTGCTPGARAAAAAATTLSVDSGLPTVRYGGTVRGSALLVSATSGAPLVGTALRLCRRTAPARTEVCSNSMTDATGTVRYRYQARANVSVQVTFAGTPTAAAASASAATYVVLAKAELTTTRHTIVATVHPAAGQHLTLLRAHGARWTAVAHSVVDRHGKATFRRLPGARYRVAVASTRTLRGVRSAMVLVRR
jgi:type VII secretion-associated serine protease mycosin